MALSLVQFAVQENAFPLVVGLTATQAGDRIICLGYTDGTVTGLASDLGNNATFLPINGVTSPRNFSGTNFFIAIITPTAGSTSVTATITGGTFNDMGCYVVRGSTNLVIDQSLLNDITSATTLILSGLTSTLAASENFAISLGGSSGSVTSINTSQSGSANFSFDTITGNGTGYANQITATNAQLQAAWDTTNNTGDAWVATFYDASAGPTTPPFLQNESSALPARRAKGVAVAPQEGIPGTFQRFIPFAPVQPVQPPNPATANISQNNRRAGALAGGDPGNEAPFVPPVQVAVPFGWQVQPVQPPNPATANISLNNRRAGAIAAGDNGIQAALGRFLPFGWPVQSVQPPNPAVANISLNNRRAAALVGGIANVEAIFSTAPPVLAAWWETLALPPPRPRWMRAAALEGGIEWGGEQFVIQWRNAGWEIQPVQPPAATKRLRQVVTYDGDDGAEAPFIPPVVSVNRWGFDPQPFAYRRPLGRFGAMAPIANIESVFVPPVVAGFTGWGFDQPPVQPLFRRVRAVVTPFNIEGAFTFTPPATPTLWESYWPQPPHPRREKAGAVVPPLALIDSPPLARFVPFWMMAPPHPEPHPRRERAGSILPPIAITESRLQVFYPTFWHVLPPEPHPMPNRGAGLLPAGVLPIVAFRAAILNPNYIAVGRPRVMVSLGAPRQRIAMGAPRNRVVLGITNQVSQTNELVPPIDDTVEVETVTFDYGLILAAGVTITSIAALTCKVVSGVDPTPSARLVGAATIGTSPNSGGANQATFQNVGTMIGGVTYRLQCVANCSDGQIISLWNHITCQTPN